MLEYNFSLLEKGIDTYNSLVTTGGDLSAISQRKSAYQALPVPAPSPPEDDRITQMYKFGQNQDSGDDNGDEF